MLKHKTLVGKLFGKSVEEDLTKWINKSEIKKSDIVSISYINASVLTVFYYQDEKTEG